MPVLKKGVIDREIRSILRDFCIDLKAGVGLDDVEQQRRLSYVCRRTGKSYEQAVEFVKEAAAIARIPMPA